MNGSELTRPHVFEPGADIRSGRTLLLLHGTGADEFDLLNLGKAIDPTANILSPRGLVDENGMNRFFIRFPDGSFDENSIKENVDELAAFIRKASVHYGFNLEKVVAVGFSNGANTAGALLQLHPDTVSVVVAFGTTKAFETSPSSPDLRGKKVFIANGEMDGYSPPAKTTQMIAEFEGFGAEVTLMMHPGGHQISSEHVQAISKALQS
jgi:phospholipase/carboxylesterase